MADYTNIDNGYDEFMNRGIMPDPIQSSPNIVNENTEFDNVRIGSAIKSKEYSPGAVGFNIDGRTGVAEFNKLKVSGTIEGASFYTPNSTNPVFSVDSSGNMEVSSLLRNDFSWVTLLESLDGFAQVAGGTITLSSQYVSIVTSAAPSNTCELQKLQPAAANSFSWDVLRKQRSIVQFVNNTDVETYIISGSYSASTDRHIGFKHIDGSLYGTCADGTTSSSVLLGTVGTGVVYTITAKFYPAEKIDFYVKGGAFGSGVIGTITTNLPSGVTDAEKFLGIKHTTTGAATKELRLSYYDFWQAEF